MEQLAANLLSLGWIPLIFAIWVGLAIGSFLNVVIYRLPVMLTRAFQREAREELEIEATPEDEETFNLATPRSTCPKCQHQIGAVENVPVVSWLWLRGKCRHCSAPISARYPLVELFTMLATLAVLGVFGFTPFGFAACVFTWMLIAASFIDFDTMLLPDQITLPLTWLGLLVSMNFGLVSLEAAVIGAVAGYLLLWTTFWGFKLITGKDGMGYGDFKLLAAIGAWLGWQVLPGVLLIASVSGLLFAIVSMIGKRMQRSQPMPFGPYLAIGGWVALLAHDTVSRLLIP